MSLLVSFARKAALLIGVVALLAMVGSTISSEPAARPVNKPQATSSRATATPTPTPTVRWTPSAEPTTAAATTPDELPVVVSGSDDDDNDRRHRGRNWCKHWWC